MKDADILRVPPAPPVTLVIFGAMGDLTLRLLAPALVNMTHLQLAGDDLRVLGVSLEQGDEETLANKLDGVIGEGEKSEAWDALRGRVAYLSGDFTQDTVYEKLVARLSGNVAFYLAVQPRFFGEIVEKLAAHKLLDEAEGAFRRVAIEKPFGRDLPSAVALNARLLACADESQLYRIDHFLGKETVQNMMTTRFANMMIETLWNANSISHVQITAAETVDVGTRGKFYDVTGALRDMVPNHLFQLLAMVAMEPPTNFSAEAIRNEKVKVLKAIRIYDRGEAERNGVRGVYEAGAVGGNTLSAYRDLDDVASETSTETFVALKLKVDSWRWAGVPFYLRTGKALAVRDTEVVVTFKPVPFAQFDADQFRPSGSERLPPNRLIIQIQPNEGISMEMLIKRPGLEVDTVPVSLDFRYADRFDIGSLTGYESLIYDLFTGDQTLFQRADAIEAGWAAVQPFLDAWDGAAGPEAYPPGSLGPEAADALLARDGTRWHALMEE